MIDKFIPGAIRGLGGLISYFLSEAAVHRQNLYNSPKQQIKRLREAGIPLAQAKYFDNAQTSLPDTSGISSAAQGIAGYQETELLNKKIYSEEATGALRWAEALSKQTQNKIDIETSNWLLDLDQYIGKIPGGTNLKERLGLEIKTKEAMLAGAYIANEMEKIKKDLQGELYSEGKLKEEAIARINTEILNNKNVELMFETNQKFQQFKQRFLDGIESRTEPYELKAFIRDLFVTLVLGGGNMSNLRY